MWTGRFASGMAQSMVDLSFSLQFVMNLMKDGWMCQTMAMWRWFLKT